MAKRDIVKVPDAPAPPPPDVILLTEIRDLLKQQQQK
jgi:large-conductance mechanosensitive channel